MRAIRATWCAICLILPLLLAGCSTTPQTNALLDSAPPDWPRHFQLEQVPFVSQEAYQCGPASLAMLLQFNGIQVTSGELKSLVYVPDKQGSFQVELIAATRQYNQMPVELSPDLQEVLAVLLQHKPVLVFQNLGLSWYQKWHYAIVTGYDLDAGEIILNSGEIEHYRISMRVFERTWRRSGHWSMIALKPGEDFPISDPRRYFLAAAAFEPFARDDAAGRVWKTGIQRWPDSTDIGMGYGNYLYTHKELAAAAEQYQHINTTHPEYAPAFNNLAQLRLDQHDIASAIALARKAVELNPDQPVFQQTLAEAIKASGQ